MATIKDYQQALDQVYQSFMTVKDDVKSFYDRDVRDPSRLIRIADEFDIVPKRSHVIRVTGSKGKGTTSRATALILESFFPKSKIGLFVSPEEIDHVDRMRINGIAITREEFVETLNELLEPLLSAQRRLKNYEYLSPSGIFLLIALKWFRKQNVEYFVLETGRGVRFDEVGQIASSVSVVTSILLEHADKLGPSLEQIARDKLSISVNSDKLVLSEGASRIDAKYEILKDKNYSVVAQLPSKGDTPGWISLDVDLAKSAASLFLNTEVMHLPSVDTSNVSNSFVVGEFKHKPFAIEGVINLDSIDQNLVRRWGERFSRLSAYCSFPDDKDRDRIIDFLKTMNFNVTEVVLDGVRGTLHYHRATADKSHKKLWSSYADFEGFREQIEAQVETDHPDFIYFLGTQTFIRLARVALKMDEK